MEIKRILPKRKIINAQRVHQALYEEMYRFCRDFTKEEVKPYPTYLATITDYRRTGTLKKSWHFLVTSRPGLIVGQVGSDPATFAQAYYHPRLKSGRLGKARRIKKPYTRYVMGKEQSRLMKGRGWKKVGDILKKEWPGQVRRFQGVINRTK